jgi:flagellar basal body L-ring protein FlgH
MRTSLVVPLAALLLTSGCASTFSKVGRWLGMGGDEKVSARAPAANSDTTTLGDQDLMRTHAADDNPNLGGSEFSPQQRLFDERAQRGYRRNADPWQATGNYNEGSLWNADSQDNYLFTRNMVNKVGDFVIVKLEADLQEVLNSKLTALYRPAGSKPKLKDTIAEEAGKAAGDKVSDAVEKTIGNKAIADAAGNDVQDRTVAALTEKPRYFTTKEVPVRITEVNGRGTIKIEGVRRLFLKNGAFDLKVSGVIREEDLGPSRMVASSRLMDQKVEITR